MHNAVYESHIFENALLPFRFFIRTITAVALPLPNWHSDIEFLYCISGQGVITYDGIEYVLNAGDLFVVNPSTLHAVRGTSLFQYSCLIVGDNFWEENGLSPNMLSFKEHIYDPCLSDIFQNIIKAYSREASGKTTSVAVIRHAILSLIVYLCEHYIQDYQYSPQRSLAVQRVMEATLYIHRNISSNITLDVLSAHLGICQSHFSREFHKITGMTVIEYVNILRCKEAKRLISEGQSVSEAAIASGFNNLSYFTRTYKKYVGELPSSNKKTDQPPAY